MAVSEIQKISTETPSFLSAGTNCGQYTANANSFVDVSYTATRAGYRPLGLIGYAVGWVSGDTGKANVYVSYIGSIADGSCVVKASIFNPASAQIKFTYTAYILWIKI